MHKLLFPTVAYLLGFIIMAIWQIMCFIKKVSIKKDLIYSLLIIYLSLLVGVTFFPLPINIPGIGHNINIIPFKSIYDTITQNSVKQIIIQLCGNIIMFFPLGILLQFMRPKMKK